MASTTNTLAGTSPSAERAAFGVPDWTAIDTGTNAALAATRAAVANKQHYATKATLSFSAAVAAAITFTIKDGTTVIFQAQIPATTLAPITFDWQRRPLHASTNTDLVAGVGAAGASVVQTITLEGFSVEAP